MKMKLTLSCICSYFYHHGTNGLRLFYKNKLGIFNTKLSDLPMIKSVKVGELIRSRPVKVYKLIGATEIPSLKLIIIMIVPR